MRDKDVRLLGSPLLVNVNVDVDVGTNVNVNKMRNLKHPIYTKSANLHSELGCDLAVRPHHDGRLDQVHHQQPRAPLLPPARSRFADRLTG
jgi:hypothetical protein